MHSLQSDKAALEGKRAEVSNAILTGGHASDQQNQNIRGGGT